MTGLRSMTIVTGRAFATRRHLSSRNSGCHLSRAAATGRRRNRSARSRPARCNLMMIGATWAAVRSSSISFAEGRPESFVRCPYCHSRDSRVIDSRELTGGESIRRRRECPVCSRRFTTYERVELAALMVVKKDGRRQEFDPEKLRAKLRIALTKRPVGEQEIQELVQKVETDLQALDQVAYIRFASVYRQFADIDELRREVEGLVVPGEEPDEVTV